MSNEPRHTKSNPGGVAPGNAAPPTPPESIGANRPASAGERIDDSAKRAFAESRKRQRGRQPATRPIAGGRDSIGVGSGYPTGSGSGNGSGNGSAADPLIFAEVESAGESGKGKKGGKTTAAAGGKGEKPVKLTPVQTAFEMLTMLETTVSMMVGEVVPMQPYPKAIMAQRLGAMMERLDDETAEKMGRILDPLVVLVCGGIYGYQVLGVLNAKRANDEHQPISEDGQHIAGHDASAVSADFGERPISADSSAANRFG